LSGGAIGQELVRGKCELAMTRSPNSPLNSMQTSQFGRAPTDIVISPWYTIYF
jgi:hypothetical protein